MDIKRHPNGVLYAHCCHFDSKTGKRKRTIRSTGIKDDGPSSRKRAAIVGAEIELHLALGHNRVARQDTIADAFKALIRRRELAGDPAATIDITMWKGKAMVEFFGPKYPAASLSDDDMVRYAMERKVSPSTIKREFVELAQALKTIKVTVPKFPDLAPGKPRERWLMPSECSLLLEEFSPERRDYILAFLQLGVRKSELWGLSARDIRITSTGTCIRVRGTKTKGSDRLIPLTTVANDVIRRRLALSGGGPLFPHWSIDKNLRAAARRAGLGPLSCNDLRRTFATQLAIAGVPILHLKALLGHASTRMLEAVYARVGGEHTGDSIHRLPALTNVRHEPSQMEPKPAETEIGPPKLRLLKSE